MSLILNWSNEQSALDISSELIGKLESLLNISAQSEQVQSGEVALSFVDDETIHELNKQYRGIDRPTDVLSFSMRETGDGELDIVFDVHEEDDEEFVEPLGDIIISVPRAIAQSEEYGHSVEREIGFLFVHGFLHLIGYDHDDEQNEREMFSKQEHILQKAGLTR